MEHFCKEHQVPFFKTANMKGYAHPILVDGEQTGKWCNEPKEQAGESRPQKQWTPSGGYKGKSPEELELSRRSFALSYAKDLAVAGQIEVKGIMPTAIVFRDWLEANEEKDTTVYATKTQLEQLTALHKQYPGEIEKLKVKHGFQEKKLTKEQAGKLIAELIVAKEA